MPPLFKVHLFLLISSISEVLEDVSNFVRIFIKQKQQEILTSNVSVLDDEDQRLLGAAVCSLTEEDVGLTMDWPSNTEDDDFNYEEIDVRLTMDWPSCTIIEEFNYEEGFKQHRVCFAEIIAKETYSQFASSA